MHYRISYLLQLIVGTALLTCTALAQDSSLPRPEPEVLLSLDHQVIEAFIAGDADLYARHLSENFVMHESGYRLSKDDAVAMVGALNCSVDENWQLSTPRVSRVSDAAYVLSYRIDMQGSCQSGGVTMTLPTPVRAATLWVYDGEAWKVAYHGENQILDPSIASAPDPESTPGELNSPDHIPAVNTAVMNSAGEPPKPGDSLTPALMAVEAEVWDTWRAHDAPTLVNLTADEIAFVNLFGDYFANKTDTIANWTGPLCNVNSFKLRAGVATLALASVGLLTVTGTVDGTCGGQDISGQRIYATSVYAKENAAWKWAFGFNSP